jgi:UDP-N-acetyl-2-amino-2-deoxyglucuronate dehydrogenase
MKDGKLGFGIIGCGVIGPHHRKAIGSVDDAVLVACCDEDEEAGKLFAEEAGGIRYYSNHEKMVQDEEVDVVCVCTPSGIHSDGVIAAAQAGKHAFCEKPLDIDRARMTAMIKACRDAGVKLGCVFQSRTSPDMQRVRQAIQDGELGQMTLGDAYLKDYRSAAYYKSAGWRGTWALDGGGALMNQGIHGVDLLLWLMGSEVESVFARATHMVRDIETEDTAVACLQYKNGAYGVIQGTTSCNPGEARRVELHGKSGTIAIAGSKITRWAVTDEEDGRAENIEEQKEAKAEGAVGDNKAISSDGHTWLIDDMCRAIREDRDPFVTGESARHGVDLVLGIYESAKTGTDVKLAEME